MAGASVETPARASTGRTRWRLACHQVEAVGVQDLGTGGDEVVHEFLTAVVLRLDLGVRTQNRVRTEDEVGAGGRVAHLSGRTVAQGVGVEAVRIPHGGHVGEGHEEVVRQRAHTVGDVAVAREQSRAATARWARACSRATRPTPERPGAARCCRCSRSPR